ncbi:hypothetical protein QW060_07535 [Myroides ceti]|uniref:Uncharacterized protein n=1 Tax=Paenimyroides ceti TaxID=395087 RepID=A0ABT8CRI8_9FLAO|nr:hypothetical protein [Paenimyroides ceti]MDN3706985.1 hypothetical protein [Paenimyroides ceti]
MKYIIIAFLIFTSMAYSQDNHIYKKVFKNKKNFKYLSFYDKDAKKKMATYKVYDSTYLIHKRTFKYNDSIYYSKKLADSIAAYGKMHGKESYAAYITKVSEILSFEEQDYLWKQTDQTKKEKIFIENKKVVMIQEIPKDELYFQVSNIIYSNDRKKAYLKIEVRVNNDIIGHSFFILSLVNKKWLQIYQDEQIFL